MKAVIKRILKKFGYQILKIDTSQKPLKKKSDLPEVDAFEIQKKIVIERKNNEMNIFDVGANVGNTIQNYLSIFPVANIFGFEAFPDVAGPLEARFSENKNIHIIKSAVGAKKSKKKFYVNKLNATNSLFPRETKGKRYYPEEAVTEKVINVDVISLDDFCKKNKINHIDILKMDIQGGELEALKGANLMLKSSKIDLIYTESYFVPHYSGAPFFHDISSYLYKLGYKVYDILNPMKGKDGQLRQVDIIFISDRFRKNSEILNQIEP